MSRKSRSRWAAVGVVPVAACLLVIGTYLSNTAVAWPSISRKMEASLRGLPGMAPGGSTEAAPLALPLAVPTFRLEEPALAAPAVTVAATAPPVTTAVPPVTYFKAPGGSNCAEGHIVDSEEDCTTAAKAVGRSFNGLSQNGARPAGCYWEGKSESYFNSVFETSQHNDWAGGICRSGGIQRTSTAAPLTGAKQSRQQPDGVVLPSGWTGPWDGPGEGQPDPPGTTFGFYFPVFDLVSPVLKVVASVRQFYPDSPIHLLNDGGHIDFSHVCKLPKYNCTSELVKGENSRWNPHSWLLRLHRVAKELGTTYIIYLEPDVLVRGRHRFHPPFDAGGIYDNFNPGLHDETGAYMQKRGREANPCFKLRWRHFGLAGGSYLRTAAVLDAFDPTNVARIDFAGLHRFESERIFSSDLAMHVALTMRGYTVYPWREVAQKWNEKRKFNSPGALAAFTDRWPAYNPEAAFEHNHKEHYGDPLPAGEQALIRRVRPGVNLVCHGCVWFRGAGLEERLPVARPESYEAHAVPHSHEDRDRLVKENLRSEQRHPEGPALDDHCLPGTSGPEVAAAAEGPRGDEEVESRVVGATPSSETTQTTPTTARGASPAGLPLAPGPRPAWLAHEDGLALDARKAPGGMLVAHTVLADGRKEWGGRAQRPAWLRAILSVNRAHAKRFGHAMVLRWMPTLRFPCPWQDRMCEKQKPERERVNCMLNLERENFNWEKHEMMLDYLRSPQNFTHVLILDADAALVSPDHNTLAQMAAALDAAGKDLFLTNEDWIGDVSSKSRINGGLLFAKNTGFTRNLFADLLDAHWYGPGSTRRSKTFGDVIGGCNSNEQLCLGSIQGRQQFASKMLMTSGTKYNCGPNDVTMQRLRAADPELEVMHFMGGGKSAAAGVLCKERISLTGEGNSGYACGQG